MFTPGMKNNFLFSLKSLAKFFAFLLLTLALFGCVPNKSDNYPPDLNKAIDLFFLENHNDEVISLLNNLNADKLNRETKLVADIYRIAAICENAKPDSAMVLLQQLPHNLTRNNPELNFLYDCLQGLILFRTNKFTESYATLFQIIDYKPIDIRAKAFNERITARICLALGDYSKGIDLLLKSSEDFELAGLPKSIAINHKIMGRNYMNVGNYSQALLSFQKAEEGLLESKDSLELFYVYINYIDYYIKTNDLIKAQYYAKLCLKQIENSKSNNMKTLVYNNMGEIEFKLKKYDNAISYFNKTLNAPTDYANVNVRHTNAHIKLSKIYREINRNDLSLYHAKIAVSHFDKKTDSKLLFKIYKNLAECYYADQSLLNAYRNLDTAFQNMDTVYNSFSATAKAYYDSKVELNKISYEMQKLEVKGRKHRQINAGVAFIFVFVLIVGFIYFRLFRSRNLVLKALVEKNLQIIEEERKIHKVSLAGMPQKPTRKVVESDKSELLFHQFLDWLERNSNFTRKDLTLENVAKEMNTNREYLSRAINEKNLRFTDLINKFRIQKAIEIISDKENPKSRYTLSVIANHVGFNSNSVFIEAFRKQTGMNPAQFRDNLQDNV